MNPIRFGIFIILLGLTMLLLSACSKKEYEVYSTPPPTDYSWTLHVDTVTDCADRCYGRKDMIVSITKAFHRYPGRAPIPSGYNCECASGDEITRRLGKKKK